MAIIGFIVLFLVLAYLTVCVFFMLRFGGLDLGVATGKTLAGLLLALLVLLGGWVSLFRHAPFSIDIQQPTPTTPTGDGDA